MKVFRLKTFQFSDKPTSGLDQASSLEDGLLTNHNPLHYHLHHIGKSPSSTCRRCHLRPETSDHFLF
ncbi:hypothetical protein BDQ17DRAFT_1251170 [Cyathus striatus]|nr:hypothetical protein BDQ17DRAFT_1251170 [Cyathus striatus]